MANKNEKQPQDNAAQQPPEGDQQPEVQTASPLQGKLDETVVGGRYLVNGVYVDANGNKHDDQSEGE